MDTMIIPIEPTAAPKARRVATYERVSSETQRERETIKTQTEALERRLGAETGIEVVARYQDDGVSGRKALADRPGGADLLRDARAGRFAELWVYKPDRLGRNLADMALTANLLHELGITVWTVSQGRLDRFLFKLMALLAEDEADRLRERFSDGADRAAREGRHNGGVVAYGYRVDGTKPHTRIVPDDTVVWGTWTAVDVVRHVYERVGVEGWSCRRATEELNALGVPTHARLEGPGRRRRATPGVWREGVVRRMLTEPKYRGEHWFGRRSSRSRELVPVPTAALVSLDLWQAAQETLARNRIAARNSDRVYLLRSVMRCTLCSQTYVGSQGRNGERWYRCGGQRRERGKFEGRCPGKGIAGSVLEPIVWGDISRFLRDPGDILDELDAERERDIERSRRAEEHRCLQAAIDGLAAQRERVVGAFARGLLQEEELVAERARIDVEETMLRAQLADLASAVAAPEPISIDLLDALRERLDAGLDEAERQEIVRCLVPGIDVTTTVDGNSKTAKVLIRYAFPVAVVRALTVTRASAEYGNPVRIVEIPPVRRGRARAA